MLHSTFCEVRPNYTPYHGRDNVASRSGKLYLASCLASSRARSIGTGQSGSTSIAHAGISHTSLFRTRTSPTRTSPTRISPTRISPTRISPTRISPTRISPTRISPTSMWPTGISLPRIFPNSIFGAQQCISTDCTSRCLPGRFVLERCRNRYGGRLSKDLIPSEAHETSTCSDSTFLFPVFGKMRLHAGHNLTTVSIGMRQLSSEETQVR